MLEGMTKFLSQLAMGDKHQSDHIEITPQDTDTLGLFSHCNRTNGGGKPSCPCKVEVQAKNLRITRMKTDVLL